MARGDLTKLAETFAIMDANRLGHFQTKALYHEITFKPDSLQRQ